MKNKGRIVCCALVFFWIIGFVGNHVEWFGSKWNSFSSAIATAKTDLSEKYEARKRANAERREKRERERRESQARYLERISEQEREKAEKEKALKSAEEAKRVAVALQERQERKLAILKEFALRESPKLWSSIEELRASIAQQIAREKSLAKSLEDVGIVATNDADYVRIVQERKTIEDDLAQLHEKLCDAYVESKKYDAEIGRTERAALKLLLEDDGAHEALATERRFERMRREK